MLDTSIKAKYNEHVIHNLTVSGTEASDGTLSKYVGENVSLTTGTKQYHDLIGVDIRPTSIQNTSSLPDVSFTMPDENVSVTANWERRAKTLKVVLTNPPATDKEISCGVGTEVTINAGNPRDITEYFSSWTIQTLKYANVDVEFTKGTNINSPNASFIMPDEDIKCNCNWHNYEVETVSIDGPLTVPLNTPITYNFKYGPSNAYVYDSYIHWEWTIPGNAMLNNSTLDWYDKRRNPIATFCMAGEYKITVNYGYRTDLYIPYTVTVIAK